jgi:methyl-accepting chemotaxis protein
MEGREEFMKLKLKGKLLTLLLTPTLILLVLLSVYAYFESKALLEKQLVETNEFEIRYFAEEFNEALEHDEARLDVAAVMAGAGTEENARAILAYFNQTDKPMNVDITVTYESGKSYFGRSEDDDSFDGRTRDWYKGARDTDKVFYTDVYTDATTGNKMVSMAKAFKHDGTFAGVLCSDLDLQALLGMIKDIKFGETGYAFLVDKEGDFISHPKFSPEENIAAVGGGALAQFYADVKSGKSDMAMIEVDGEERLYASAPVGNTGWILCASMDYDEMFSEVKNMAVIFVIADIVIALVLIAIVWAIVAKLTSRLNPLVNMANEMAKGNLRVENNMRDSSDEIGVLAKAMLEMRKSLAGLIRQVSSSSEQLAAASEELTATAEQSATVSSQIAESVNNVAEGANTQVKAVNNVLSEVEHISGNIKNMDSNTNTAVKLSNDAESDAVKGTAAINDVVKQMTAIETAVGDSAKVVEKLGEQSKEIGMIVETISGIAGQTNLLALNAAIEAARAGEQGKGFSVVAEEVRKLAEGCQEAAKHIADIVSHIQSETAEAVQSMHKGEHEVKVGADYVKNAGQIFTQIAAMVGRVNTQVQETLSSMHEIESGSRQITASTQDIHGICQQSSEETQSVSAATEEQTAAMHEISTASRALAELAQNLQNELGKFKL